MPATEKENGDELETATLAGGCFWCTEAVFDRLRGVESVESGYIGGDISGPTYEQVCGGGTGHAEAIRIRFDPEAISYGTLLEIFFATHDPTQLNRQGNDVGTQYRSAIFPHSSQQEAAARAAIAQASADWPTPIVTTLEPAGPWWKAEDAHQQYYERVGDRNPYCTVIITPKVRKLMTMYKDRLKRPA